VLRKRAFTQANLFVRRVLEQMGITSLDEAIARLRGSGVPAEARVADFLDNRRQAVRELARDLIERRLALAADERSRARDEFLRDASLTNVDRRDLERMRLLVRTMARKLATRYGRTRKRARRGVLDTATRCGATSPSTACPSVRPGSRRKSRGRASSCCATSAVPWPRSRSSCCCSFTA
jgi:hypothetical protein